MDDPGSNTEAYYDLTALFLPDILHTGPNRQADEGTSGGTPQRFAARSPKMDFPHYELKMEPADDEALRFRQDEVASFNTFITNNDFIANSGEYQPAKTPQPFAPTLASYDAGQAASAGAGAAAHYASDADGGAYASVQHCVAHPAQPNPYINHYAGYVPIEAAAAAARQQQRPNPFVLPQQQTFNPDLVWYGNSYEQSYMEKPLLSFSPVERADRADRADRVASDAATATATATATAPDPPKPKPPKKARDRGVAAAPHAPRGLTRLLDLKPAPARCVFRITDGDNNEINVEMAGFLNGRFYTNDVDNRNYYRINDSEGPPAATATGGSAAAGVSAAAASTPPQPPKILSCYRRNFIQVSLNLHVRGLRAHAKALKIHTEPGATRAVKWLKLEVLANTNFSDVENVPMIVADDSRDKDRRPKKYEPQAKSDFTPTYITAMEHVIEVADLVAASADGDVDSFYAIKKLQFKSATPNNGKLSFQNYYNLIIRLSAVVDAYDGGDNDIGLVDLVSQPMIVRGRNPSFYEERNDVSIPARVPSDRESYRAGRASPPVDPPAVAVVTPTPDLDSEGGASVASDASNDSLSPSDDDLPKPKPIQPYGLQERANKSLPPLVYSATTSSSINLKSILDQPPVPLQVKSDKSRYKYFPISNVYYLPPINSVYFPHGVHQGSRQKVSRESSVLEDDDGDPHISPQRRKSSNVYFK
ncbi:hypothetical protein ABC855_g2602 [[Candida] zeylanoides]